MSRHGRTFSRNLMVASVMVAVLPFAAQAATPKRVKPGTGAAPAATSPAKPAAPAGSNVPLLPGAGSKEPVSIDAAKLDYFDKEQKLVYTGDVVAVQGESTMKASVLTIFLQKQDPAGQAGATAPAAPAAAPAGFGGPTGGSSVRHMEADGPVTLISKDQVGTGDHATYDKAENRVYMNGNVTLSQGTNVTQGDRLIYDLTNGQAQVFSGTTNARVKSVFTPGSGSPGDQPDKAAPASAEEAGVPKHKAQAAGKSASRKTSASGKAANPTRVEPASPADATAEQ